MLPEVDEEDAAGVVAMATAARLGRGVEIARSKEAESSGSEASQQCGGRLWSAREQSGRSEQPPLFKYWSPCNGKIQNQRPDLIRPGILRRKDREER